MKLLLLNTSGPKAFVALMDDKKIIAERRWESTKQLGQQLLVVISELLTETGWTLPALDRIAVHHGPGHFSALRQGVVTATMLGYACGVPVVPVSSTIIPAMIAEAEAAMPLSLVTPHYTGISPLRQRL